MSNRKVTYIVIAHEAFKDPFFETITIEEGEDIHDAIHNFYYDLHHNGDYDEGENPTIYTDFVLKVNNEHNIQHVHGVDVTYELPEGDYE